MQTLKKSTVDTIEGKSLNRTILRNLRSGNFERCRRQGSADTTNDRGHYQD